MSRLKRVLHTALCGVVLSLTVGQSAAGCTPDEQVTAQTPKVTTASNTGDAQATPDANTSALPAESSPSPSPTPDAIAKEDVPDLPLPPPLRFERKPAPPLQTGWAIPEEHADISKRAWVEGEIEGGDRLTINTENMRRFTLDLSRLRLNWSKRIVLRMDGFNSELTKKRWPKLHFARTPSGAWDVIDDK